MTIKKAPSGSKKLTLKQALKLIEGYVGDETYADYLQDQGWGESVDIAEKRAEVSKAKMIKYLTKVFEELDSK